MVLHSSVSEQDCWQFVRVVCLNDCSHTSLPTALVSHSASRATIAHEIAFTDVMFKIIDPAVRISTTKRRLSEGIVVIYEIYKMYLSVMALW